MKKQKLTLVEKQTINKWKTTGLLDNIIKLPEKALLAAKELEEHAQYALDHMSEHEDWINTDLPLAQRKKQDWANWYLNERVKEMRLRGCFSKEQVGDG